MKLDWNDITIVPACISEIESRNEVNPYINGKLPLFTAPMDTVISLENMDKFYEQGINICLPRGLKTNNINYFMSYGLDEIIDIVENDKDIHNKVLIDVANGNMIRLYNISKKIKDKYNDKIELMIGNIANPETYRKYCEIGVDWVRCGIGGGSACTTSANVSIHYPMASLISECNIISKEFVNPTKIIADGGFKNYSDVIKALALGSNAVMLGSIFSKSLESCGDNYQKIDNSDYQKIDNSDYEKYYKSGIDIYKYYRGMSTKEVQISQNRKQIKTGEGISKYNKVEYTLSGWRENFEDYLKSAMSYTNSRTLNDFIGNVKWTVISQNTFNRFNK
jgi:IMP dehydrogenase/GMP reductase